MRSHLSKAVCYFERAVKNVAPDLMEISGLGHNVLFVGEPDVGKFRFWLRKHTGSLTVQLIKTGQPRASMLFALDPKGTPSGTLIDHWPEDLFR